MLFCFVLFEVIRLICCPLGIPSVLVLKIVCNRYAVTGAALLDFDTCVTPRTVFLVSCVMHG